MIVLVVVDRQAARILAEQLDEGRVAADLLRVPRAADVAIEADHLIGGAHHQVQVVGDHQHTAAVAVAQHTDQPVQLGLAGDVDALHRFVEYQQLRLAQQRAGEQHALHLAAGNLLQRAVDHMLGADFTQRCEGTGAVDTGYQAQEAQHRQGQGGVDVQLLRHVADAQLRLAPDLAAIGLEQAEHGAHQGGLAGTVGADQGDDLAAMHLQLRAFQHILVGEAHMDVIQPQQYLAHAAFRQFEQSPTTSTV